MSHDELISVIVPAHNAERHLAETLTSIASQTYRSFEAIIVDDGSGDGTGTIARRFAEGDPRFRLVTQDNGGVARARNAGLAAARGRLVAPCDADDLWAPTKLEKQLATWRAAGPEIGLVYCWSATIDEAGYVISYDNFRSDRGWVFETMCRVNLVANGSSALMDRELVLALGGYDQSLRARRAEGCEDYKLYLQIAERRTVDVVTEYLTGYRNGRGNMSNDVSQMMRSFDLVAEELAARVPEARENLAEGRFDLLEWMRRRAFRRRRPIGALVAHWAMMRDRPFHANKTLYWSYLKPLFTEVVRGDNPPETRRQSKGGPHKFLGALGSGALWPSEGAGGSGVVAPGLGS